MKFLQTRGFFIPLLILNLIGTPAIAAAPAPAPVSDRITVSEHESHGLQAVDEMRVPRSGIKIKGRRSRHFYQHPAPDSPAFRPGSGFTLTVVATAYSPRPQETDATPYTTALGTDVRDGIIAANFLPFGAKIRIPDLFGNKVFVVEDRMHRRFTNAYPHRIDLFYYDTAQAIRFGKKTVAIEIVERELPAGAVRAKTAERTSLRPTHYSDS